MPFTETFDEFTNELAHKVNAAKIMGWPQEEIVNKAKDIADWLSKSTEPKSPEQRLLKEIWDVASQPEQHALASCLVKMIQKKGTRTSH